MRKTATLSTAVLALVLVGCSSGQADQKTTEPQVAALPSTAATTAAGRATSAGDSGNSGNSSSSARPQIRLDDTDARRDALIRAWDLCLIKNGAHYATANDRPAAGPADSTGKPYPVVAEPIPAKARSACRNQLPLGPPELEPDQNPHYRDDWLANVKCLRAKGYQIHLTTDSSAGPGGLTWTYDDNSTFELPDNAEELEKKCMLTAFGNRK